MQIIESIPEEQNLQDLSYDGALMFSIRELRINVVLEDYSVIHFDYQTEVELARNLETWTHGDNVKQHFPGSQILESYIEDPVVEVQKIDQLRA
jgi:hypothetical protein